jgi:hypothetical protein
MDQERVELIVSSETLRDLHQVSIYKGTPSFKELINKYIERGLRRDKEKMEATRRLTLERQNQINEMSKLLKKVCPHCQTELSVIETSPLSRWQGEFIGVCMNNSCPYFVKSWEAMKKQGHHAGYRYYRDARGSDGPLAVGPIEHNYLLDG